jgi:hypothetical protein
MKKLFVFLFTLVAIPLALAAQTPISGTISNNTTLTAANSPYEVTGHLTVNAGVTLTVESGVELRFGSNIYLVVYGTLTANSATFTANGSTTPGYWQGIYVSYQNNDAFGQVNLDNCTVEYAQSLFVRKGDLNMTGTSLSQFSSFGLDIYTLGTVNVDNTTIQDCTYPVYFRDNGGNGHWTVGDGVDLTGNATDYVFIDFRDVSSDFRMPDVGIPYYYNSELRITETGTLRIDPGVSLLGNTGAYITVYGKIKANGTAEDPILFGNEPSSGYWAGFNVMDQSVDTACVLTHCRFSGANYTYYDSRGSEIGYCAVEIQKSSPSFSDCEFSDNRYNLVVTGRSFPSFTDCDFLASISAAKQTYNINMDLNAEPVFNNCSIGFNSSEGRAIGLIASTIYDDSHLTHRSFAGIDSITYTLYGQAVIQDTASLVIDPGIVIKCTSSSDYLYANGALTGIGTAGKPIVFTWMDDDSYGNPGDTYNDGTTSISTSASGRVILNGLPTSTLDHWKILYGGGANSSYYAAYAYNGNIIRNSEIRYAYRGILFMGDAQLLNNDLENITYYPLARRMNAGAPVLIGNTVANSGNLGIFVHDFLDGTYSIGGLDIGANTNVAYIIDTDTPIPTTANVTILPGTVFKFANYYGKLSVRGGLKADGNKNNKIIFTSIYDNSAAGNTNFNTGADPTGYKWDGIEFYSTSNDALNELDNCEVRYVNYGIRMTDCRVVVDSVLLNFANSYALAIYGSANPAITHSAFNNLGGAPIYMDMFANPTFSGNTIANVSQIGISIRGGTISGTIPARNFAGYDTITYLLFENLRVDDQLTIPGGLTFKGNGSNYFDIYGRLNVLGTASRPVVFTTLQDDAYGKPADTEQNGAGSVYTNGYRLVFRDLSDDNSMVDHALFRYSYSYGVYAENASPTVSNTTFHKTASYGLYLLGAAAPTVENCVFNDVPFPIITSLMTFPGSESGNVLSGTTARGILVINNETLTQNYTLTPKSFAGIANIPYIFDTYTIGTSAVLTIAPGVVCKFRQNGYLYVRNGLIAEGGGTPDSAIVLTSDRDDFYGGDTYGDGDANLPNDHWWRGIYFPQEAIDASCLLDNCIIKNASYQYTNNPNSNNRAGVTIDNASPTVQNCLFEDDYWAIIARNTSLPTITNCDFVGMNPTYGYGVWNENGVVTVTAENCWWNDVTGPYHATLNPGGLGERVSDNVDFTPWITQVAKPIMGDVSLNGEVMPYDASLVLQHTVGNITLDEKQLGVADVSGNGTVSSYDASMILQYSIGLITSFEPSGNKSGSLWENLAITVPPDIQAGAGSRFEIPVSFTTPATVKSLDLQITTDPQHVKFIGLNGGDLPPDIMVASGYQESSGILKLSFASAYDLDLNLDVVGLIFETGDLTGESDVALISLTANETDIPEPLFRTTIQSRDEATGLGSSAGLSTFNVYSVNGMFVAGVDLAERQSRLILSVYDMAGRLTNRLVLENPETGPQQYSFSPDGNGGADPGRLYLVTIRGDDFLVTQKIVLK